MAKAKRNIGLEILEGLRAIKRGDYGRVTTVPSISSIRERPGYRNRSSPSCWVFRYAPCKSGSKGVERPLGQLVLFCSSRRRIRKHCLKSHEPWGASVLSRRYCERPKCSRLLALFVGFREDLIARLNVGTANTN